MFSSLVYRFTRWPLESCDQNEVVKGAHLEITLVQIYKMIASKLRPKYIKKTIKGALVLVTFVEIYQVIA